MNNQFSTNEEIAAKQASLRATDPAVIMEKLAQQQAAEKKVAEKRVEQLEREMSATQPTTFTEETIPELDVQPPDKTSNTTKSKIAELEKELGIYDSMPTSKKGAEAKSFLDEFGDETFYVENVSNGHVVISDVDMDKIPRGKVLDLLRFAPIESLKKSRDLRVAMSGYGGTRLLKRLTPVEYMQRMERELQTKKKIDQYRQLAEARAQSQTPGEEPESIRPLIDSKLEKLRLGYGSDPTKGISPVEFMEWIRTETLTMSELDYILGSVQDKDVRLFILEKKKQVMEDNA